MKVLIADDDPVQLRLLETLVDSWGHEVSSAIDGTQAYAMLEAEGAPKVAILDWLMPGIDGGEICRRIKKDPNTPYVFVIMLTGKDDPSDMIEGLEFGADEYLAKPLNTNLLRDNLKRAESWIASIPQ